MKRIITVLLCIFVSSMIFAELNPPHRYFEVGLDIGTNIGNNWINLSDIQNETLVLDFTEMANNLKDGYKIDFNSNVKTYFNINAKDHLRIGFFAGVDGIGALKLSQSLLDFVGNGNASGDHSINAAVGMDMSLYLESGFSLKTFLGKLGIGMTSTMFIPAIYVPRRESSVNVSFLDDASIRMKAKTDFTMYSLFNLENSETISVDLSHYTSDAGLDISLGSEYALMPSLDVGLSLNHIPIVPAKMRYKMSYSMEIEENLGSIIDMSSSEESEENSFDNISDKITSEEITYTELENPYTIYRPVELCAAAKFRPFGEWFDVNGSVGVVFHKPVYMNYSIGTGLHFVKMCKMGGHLIDLSLTSGYEDRVWTQQFNFALNLRLLEFTFSASSCGSEFLNSFTGSGLGFGIGFKMGF